MGDVFLAVLAAATVVLWAATAHKHGVLSRAKTWSAGLRRSPPHAPLDRQWLLASLGLVGATLVTVWMDISGVRLYAYLPAAVFAFATIRRKEGTHGSAVQRTVWWLILIATWSFVSASVNEASTVFWVAVASVLPVVLLASRMGSEPRAATTTVRVLGAAVWLVCGMVAVESVVGDPIFSLQYQLGEANVQDAVGRSGVAVRGPFYGPNILVQWLVLTSIVVTYLRPAVPIGMLLAVAWAVAVTESRIGWLAVAVTGLILLEQRTSRGVAKAGLVAATLALVAVPFVAAGQVEVRNDRLERLPGDLAVRLEADAVGLDLTEQSPLFGVGYNRYEEALEIAELSAATRPHNGVIRLAQDHGLPVAATFVILLVGWLVELRRAGGQLRRLAAATAPTLVLFLSSYESAVHPWTLPTLGLLMGFTLGHATISRPIRCSSIRPSP